MAKQTDQPPNAAQAGIVLGTIPEGLRKPLLAALGEIVANFREQHLEPSELNGGKLSEVVYTILPGYVDGAYAASPSKPGNMVTACRQLEQAPGAIPRSIRIQIPRMLLALYEIRNNRGVGHVGGDVDPNHMDAVAVLYIAKWIVAELVRIFHNVDTQTAAAVVDDLVEREIPLIWEVGGVRRVLNPKLTHKQKTLVVLYGNAGPLPDRALQAWIEHPRLADFRKDVLKPMHKQKLIEYDSSTGLVHLSPLGVEHVEKRLRITPAVAA